MKENKSELGKISIATVVILLILAAAVVGVVALANGGEKGDDTATEEGKKGEDGENEQAAPIPVEIAQVGTESISSWITATANLVAENEVQVISESAGRVSSFRFEEGQRVNRGDVMAVMVGDEERMGLAKARARAENAEAVYNRAEGLFQQDLIPRGDFDKTGMEKRVADQELAEARYRLSQKTVRAPISGVVSLRTIQNGQQINPGDQLYTITDFDPLIADLYLPEREAMTLSPGRTVRISPKADESISFAGQIRRVSPVVDTATGTVKITIEAGNPPSGIRPGAFVEIGIVREEHEGAIVIPKDAVIRELARSFVFIDEGGLAKKKIVETGIEDGKRIEILSGLEPGQRVIVAGQGGLKEDTPIKVVDQSTQTAL